MSITKAHRARFRAIQEIGCIACRADGYRNVPPDIHHLLSGGRRRGHEDTIGLCPWHHRGVGTGPGISYAQAPRAFRERYGQDDELLAQQDQLILDWLHLTGAFVRR